MASLSGQVRDPATGLPVVGAEVNVYRFTDGARLGTTRTDGNGNWSFRNLPDNTTFYVVVLYGGGRVVVDTGQQTVTGPLPPNSVGQIQLQDGAVTAPKLADMSVGTSKIQDGAVTAQKLAAGSVGQQHIQAGAVTDQAISAVHVSKVLDKWSRLFLFGG
jgi:hypothetical protein